MSKKKYAFSNAKHSSINTRKSLVKLNAKITQLYQKGKIQESLILSQQALKQFPNDLTLLKNAGAFSGILGQIELAKQYTLKSLEINPYDANLHSNLALIFQQKEQPNEAERHYKEALSINSSNSQTYNNFATFLTEQKRFNEAKKYYQKALNISPNNATIYHNLAIFFQKQGQFNKSKEYYQKALNIDPNYTEAHNGFGVLLQKEKKFDKAKEHYQMALKVNPNYIETKWNLSLLNLTLIKFGEGFELYESRYHPSKRGRGLMKTISPNVSTPQYQGENIRDKHILVCLEQGIGDTVMFASVLLELVDSGAKITLACNTRLIDLFNRSFDFLTAIPKDKDNRYQDLDNKIDYWMFIGSLPKFYRNDIKDFGKHKHYLKVDNVLLHKWQDRFNNLEHNTNIGISWAGGATAENKRDRSLTLEKILPILTKASQSANIINLQYGDRQQEINNFKRQTGITIHDWEDADPLKDLDNFTSQIKALDLVISIDNSTVHFAGALGVKTYVMLPFNQDWRWAEDRDDSYWYPNVMQLFRQNEDGKWDDVIQNVANTLE